MNTVESRNNDGDADEVLFLDKRYEPPIPITSRLIVLSAMTERQRGVYELDAQGVPVAEIVHILGLAAHTVRNTRPRARYKMRNVLRAEGLITDGVPVPSHRVPFEGCELTERAVKTYGIKPWADRL